MLETSRRALCISHCCYQTSFWKVAVLHCWAGVLVYLQMEWPALSPDLNPIENLVDQLSRLVEARNSAPQNLNDLRAAHQEEWDAMPQQTISRLVNSMRRRCQAVIDAHGHMTSY
uniref:Tc1-like transposase DDE domain-containing protein n=1 Tax=Astyanax mexicanus TaxID=7994 RepID=A0A3B1KIJ0_ASTMX